MSNGDWELDFGLAVGIAPSSSSAATQEPLTEITPYCPICEGRGPVTLAKCSACGRVNPEQMRGEA